MGHVESLASDGLREATGPWAESRTRSGPGPRVMPAAALEGDEIYNSRGEKLGKIRDIMIDVRRGCVAYAILSRGGLLNLGEKLFAVPWAALTLDARGKRFLLDLDPEQLDAAPGFDKAHWPTMADTAWANQLHSYYRRAPYWK